MGGGTWVYVGRYFFNAGESEKNCVVLSNLSAHNGVVSADAVRFGGGMGNISRGEGNEGEPLISRLPRYLEGARYSTQWYGIPYSFYSSPLLREFDSSHKLHTSRISLYSESIS